MTMRFNIIPDYLCHVSRRYTKKYTKNIILAGINYDPKSKDHQCLIERLC